MAEIRVTHLRREFGDFIAVQDSNFTIRDGEFFMLLGPSGCGKTTTLRMIAGLEMPTSGDIMIDDEVVTRLPARDRDIAFVFQMFALYPHMNVKRNIAYPLVSQGCSRAEVRARVAEAAALLGISDLLERPVSGLSSGDRQRVALGRALVRRPKAFMMDEPLGALDAEFREHMAQELRELHSRIGATTVYVTHDQLEAMQMGDKIVVMNHGWIEQFGTPREIYDFPASMFVADFIGSPPMNLIPCTGRVGDGGDWIKLAQAGPEVPCPRLLEDVPERQLVLGVRPEHLSFSDTSTWRGVVEATEYLGTTQLVTVETMGVRIRARVSSRESVAVGAPVGLAVDARRVSIFDQETGRALRSVVNAQVLDRTAQEMRHG
jgi:multiple sugar transport system ATP-binding protein